MNAFIRIAAAVGLAALSTAAFAASGYKYLNVNLITQEHSNWCWAGTSVDVLNWYGKTPSQCAVANWAFGRSDACGNGTFNWNSYANSANSMYGVNGSIQAILSHWGVSSYGNAYSLSFAGVVTEVNASRPFIMRFGWYGGGGHFLVGYGYDDRSGTQTMAYMNPWPGEGYTWSNYSWTTYASRDHTWTNTLRMN
jgi:hypothetical protein